MSRTNATRTYVSRTNATRIRRLPPLPRRGRHDDDPRRPAEPRPTEPRPSEPCSQAVVL